MRRKNTAISASFIQCSMLRPPTVLCQRRAYAGPIEEFASKTEIAVQMINRIPLDFSESKNLLNVFDNVLSTIAIRHWGDGGILARRSQACLFVFRTRSRCPLLLSGAFTSTRRHCGGSENSEPSSECPLLAVLGLTSTADMLFRFSIFSLHRPARHNAARGRLERTSGRYRQLNPDLARVSGPVVLSAASWQRYAG